jgi:hypothetical protein
MVNKMESLKNHGNIDKYGKYTAYFTLNDNYWDCECEHDFIHTVEKNDCSVCRAIKEEQPNSRNNEIEILIENKNKAIN